MELAVDAERDRWLCFFRGLNVFGRGKIAMPELQRRCNKAFDKSGLPVRFLDYYRGTGNALTLCRLRCCLPKRSCGFCSKSFQSRAPWCNRGVRRPG
mgnify:CR=1 FL=1